MIRDTTTASAPPLAGTRLEAVMHRGLIECSPDADLPTVARIMGEHGVHCVVVAGIERRDASGERPAWGIISDLDLMEGLSRAGGALAGELAATELVSVEAGDTLAHAAQLMTEHQTAHLVVVDETDGRPVGVVSTLDVARAL